MAEVNGNIALLAHLMRRAGFGATRSELESLSTESYQEIVEDLLIPANPQAMPDDVIWRYHHEQSGMMGQANPGAYWLYKMISTNAPLQEKMALFGQPFIRHHLRHAGHNRRKRAVCGETLNNVHIEIVFEVSPPVRIFRLFNLGSRCNHDHGARLGNGPEAQA